jgi:hypothetical protein
LPGTTKRHPNAFVLYRAVSLQAKERIAQRFRRGLYVIEEAQLAKIDALGQVNSEKIVLQDACDEVEKSDLILYLDRVAWIFHLLSGQTRSLEQWLAVKAGFGESRQGNPRYSATSGRKRTEPRSPAVLHMARHASSIAVRVRKRNQTFGSQKQACGTCLI